MPGSLEMTTRDNLQGVADVDNERTRLVWYVIPLLVTSPNLKTRDWHREQQSRQTKVCMTVHAETLRCFLGLFLNWSEQGVAEVAFAGWAAV